MREEDAMYWVKDGLKYCKVCGEPKNGIYQCTLASYQLLIIDDLGVERNSEYALGIIFSVIDRRIRSGRPLIITTNLPLNEIKSETMLDKRRIYDRILEMCTPMYVGGASKREAIASMKMEKAKTLLNTNKGEE